MSETRVSEILQRWTRAKSARGLWPHHWEDLSRVMILRRLGFVTDNQPGDHRRDELFDGTAMQAARDLANTVGGMLRPEGEPWFFLKVAEGVETGEAEDWIADTEQRMRDAFNDPKARFRQATGECDLDLVVLGTAEMFVGEVVGNFQLLFQSVWLNDGLPFYGETGNVEGMFRSRRLTIRQAMARNWNLSEATRKKIEEKKLDEKVEFLFVVTPRDEGRKGAIIARNLPISNIVIEVEAQHIVAETGFHEFPYVVARWDTSSGEDYGRSPGMIALPDANSSQAIGETMLVAGQRAADPPLLTPSDAFLDAPNTFPGGLAPYEAEAVRDLGTNPIRFLESGGNFPLTRDIQRDTREQIRTAFLRDVFNLPQAGDATMTATEVIARQKEFIRQMGPVFGRLETDYTAPMVERAFNVMLRAGAFAEIPEDLQSVRFEYESPVKKIKEQSDALAANEWALGLANFENVRPGVFDNVNTDELAQFTAKAANLPRRLINSEERVLEIRTQRAAAEAAAAQAEQIATLAASAKDASAVVDTVLPRE